MSQIDFTQFKAPDAVNRKKPGGLSSKTQSFDDLKYRKAANKKTGTVIAKFFVSDARFESLGLITNELLATIHPTTKQVLIGVVGAEKGNLLKKREGKEKGQAFKSDTVEAALLATGVIADLPAGSNQFIKLTQVGTNVVLEKETCSVVFLLEKGEAKAKVEGEAKVAAKEVKAEAKAEPQADAKVAVEAPVATPAAAVADEDWN